MNFAHAEKIATAARELDDAISLSNARSTTTEKYINTLHACAINLAGDRAHELYADDTELDSVLRVAGIAGCHTEEETHA